MSTPAERYAAGLQALFGDENRSYTAGKPGPRFTRIEQTYYGQRSVHAFVENSTGYVLKAAGWTAPAKGVRYTSVEEALAAIKLQGSPFSMYLYRR